MSLQSEITDAVRAGAEDAAETIISAVVAATSQLAMDPEGAHEVLEAVRDNASTWADALGEDVRAAAESD